MQRGISEEVTGIADLRLQGIIYFDVELHGLAIMEKRVGCQLMRDSPIKAEDCFAFYDEMRTRGSDLKLNAKARALMTLSLGTRKDQVMQAVGRLCKLDMGQCVSFFGSQEVDRSIQEAWQEVRALEADATGGDEEPMMDEEQEQPVINSMDVLFWTIKNTVHSTDDSLMLWGKQGTSHCSVRGNPLQAAQGEVNNLRKFYGSALKGHDGQQEVVDAQRTRISKAVGGGSHEIEKAYYKYLGEIDSYERQELRGRLQNRKQCAR